MVAIILKYLLSFVKFHPETWKSRPVWLTIIGGAGVALSAVATSLTNNDTNLINYVKDLAPLVAPVITMYWRDTVAKGNQKQADSIKKVEEVINSVMSTKI
jgi:hypothetical protein